MYEGDPYHPTDANDDVSDGMSTVISKGVQKRKRGRTPAMNLLYEMDKGYYVINREIAGKQKTVEIFSTPTTPGSTIRDAITGGVFLQSKVGSAHENLFYKVRMTTIPPKTPGDVITLFFDNPEQCERHLGCTIHSDVKSMWQTRFYNTKHGQEKAYA
jgi:hypothetical protein